MKHANTPGPWRITDEMRGVGNVRVHGVESASGHGSVANCGADDTGAANARLIAAAPDLLEALQSVADFWAGGDIPAEIDAAMRAAIAKATS